MADSTRVTGIRARFVKFKDAELIGVPTIVVVGKGYADGVVEVKDRATGERVQVPVEEAVAHVIGVVRGAAVPRS